MRFALLACLAIAIGCSQEVVDRAPGTGSELALPAAIDTNEANDTPAPGETPAADDSNNAQATDDRPAPVPSEPELPSYGEALDIADHESRLVQVARFDLDSHERQQASLKKQREDESQPSADDSSKKPDAEKVARIDADLKRVSKEIEASKDSLRRAQARLDYATDIVNQIIKRDGREKSAE